MKGDVCGARSVIDVRRRVAVASEELAQKVRVGLFVVGGEGLYATVGWQGVYPLCWMLNSAEAQDEKAKESQRKPKKGNG
jgi:hypothetical protein